MTFLRAVSSAAPFRSFAQSMARPLLQGREVAVRSFATCPITWVLGKLPPKSGDSESPWDLDSVRDFKGSEISYPCSCSAKSEKLVRLTNRDNQEVRMHCPEVAKYHLSTGQESEIVDALFELKNNPFKMQKPALIHWAIKNRIISKEDGDFYLSFYLGEKEEDHLRLLWIHRAIVLEACWTDQEAFEELKSGSISLMAGRPLLQWSFEVGIISLKEEEFYLGILNCWDLTDEQKTLRDTINSRIVIIGQAIKDLMVDLGKKPAKIPLITWAFRKGKLNTRELLEYLEIAHQEHFTESERAFLEEINIRIIQSIEKKARFVSGLRNKTIS